MPDIDLPVPGEDPNWATKLNNAIEMVSAGVDAIPDQFDDLVNDAIADSTVVQAGIDAGIVSADIPGKVEDAVSDLDVVLGTDPRLPVTTDSSGLLVAITDSDGYRTWLEANDTDGGLTPESATHIGKRFIPRSAADGSGLLVAITDSSGYRTWLEANDVDGGLTPESVAYIKQYVPLNDGANPGEYVAYGDSMTGLQAGTGLLYPQVLSNLLGKPVVNRGISGETSFEIAYRQGGLQYLINIPGGVLPATTAPVTVTLANPPAGGWSSSSQPNRVSTGTLYGIPFTLTYTTSTATWSIARVTAGSAIAVPDRIPFIKPVEYTASTQIIWAGRNDPNPNKATTPPANVDLMVKHLAGGSQRFLVVSVYNRTNGGEGVGTGNYNDIMAGNLAMQNLYPRNYADMRKHMILNGLAVAGITPTVDDQADIARDEVPRSLMYDDLHPNEAGRYVEGVFIHQNLVWRGLA